MMMIYYNIQILHTVCLNLFLKTHIQQLLLNYQLPLVFSFRWSEPCLHITCPETTYVLPQLIGPKYVVRPSYYREDRLTWSETRFLGPFTITVFLKDVRHTVASLIVN